MKNIFTHLLILAISSNAFASFPVKRASNDSSIEIVADDNTSTAITTAVAGDNQIVALVLCWFLGIIGVHRFYLGDTWQGIVQLLTLGGLGIWTLIDFIRIAIGDLGPGW